MRASERRRIRVRRQCMTVITVLLLMLLAIGGIGYGITQGIKNKEKQELLETGISRMDSGNYEAAVECGAEGLELGRGI